MTDQDERGKLTEAEGAIWITALILLFVCAGDEWAHGIIFLLGAWYGYNANDVVKLLFPRRKKKKRRKTKY